jgi:glycosyl transferase family 25
MPADILNKPAAGKLPRVDDAVSGPLDVTVEIVVISLPSATERRLKIDALFQGTGLNWSYFDAHTSLKHSGLQYDVGEIKRRFRPLSGPEIAVCSSHVAVLSNFLERGSTEYVLVLEDDVIFDTDFPLDKFSAFCSEKGIDYIRLFGKHYAKAIRLDFFFDRSIVRYLSSPAGAQAYLMSKAGARRFLESYRSIDVTVDLAMDRFWTHQLPIYSIFPYPIIERFSPTSIPMPLDVSELKSWRNLEWQYNRTVTRVKKIWANIALRGTDRRMKRESLRFRQIFDSKPGDR